MGLKAPHSVRIQDRITPLISLKCLQLIDQPVIQEVIQSYKEKCQAGIETTLLTIASKSRQTYEQLNQLPISKLFKNITELLYVVCPNGRCSNTELSFLQSINYFSRFLCSILFLIILNTDKEPGAPFYQIADLDICTLKSEYYNKLELELESTGSRGGRRKWNYKTKKTRHFRLNKTIRK